MADATYQPLVYRKQGGSELVVASGGSIDIESGGALKVAGVDITSSITDTNVTVANKTGGPLTKGTLVYVSGYDTTLGAPSVTKADADTNGKISELVLSANIANDAAGVAYTQGAVTGIDTSGASAVGSIAYLSCTAGEFAWSAPASADDVVQVVGVCKVKNASTGSIYFFPAGRVVTLVPTSGLTDGCVGTTQIADDAVTAAKTDTATAGTVEASKIVVVDANKDVGDFRNLDAVNLDAGTATGTAGTVDIFPGTTTRGKLTIQCAANTDDFGTILTNAANSTSVKTATIPALTGYVGLSTAALSLAEMDLLDGAGTGGTVVASKVQVGDANQNLGAVKATALHIGTSGSETQVTATADELNLLDGITRGSILRGGDGVSEELVAKTSGQILVGDGTDIVSVAVSGDVTLAATGAVTIAANAVEAGMVADDQLDGSHAANYATSGLTPCIPVLYSFAIDGGAAADDDFVVAEKILVTDVWAQHTGGAGESSDTLTVKLATNAITDAMAWSGADNVVVRAANIIDAYATVAAGATIRITTTDDDSQNDVGAGIVYILGHRVA